MSERNTTLDSLMVNATSINSTELRASTRDILERARFQGERFLVFTHGKPMAIVMGLAELESLVSPDLEEITVTRF
jgi:antitoxin (DNA-binding transcriptional repressor) of toxin-antitoxin stability system